MHAHTNMMICITYYEFVEYALSCFIGLGIIVSMCAIVTSTRQMIKEVACLGEPYKNLIQTHSHTNRHETHANMHAYYYS